MASVGPLFRRMDGWGVMAWILGFWLGWLENGVFAFYLRSFEKPLAQFTD